MTFIAHLGGESTLLSSSTCHRLGTRLRRTVSVRPKPRLEDHGALVRVEQPEMLISPMLVQRAHPLVSGCSGSIRRTPKKPSQTASIRCSQAIEELLLLFRWADIFSNDWRQKKKDGAKRGVTATQISIDGLHVGTRNSYRLSRYVSR
ncbi:hypothetical protein CGRA01v4_04722 [Colletotrichum graminicola]|nr:hypothetical protein CGRA01v4_04722 [Colletotrichum graminicola]